MDRTGLKAVLLTMLFVFSTSLASVEINLTESTNERSTQQGALGVVDVPTYRIGDEWVYETKFDVAQLIAQANVSASLNTLTGDTVNTVTDIIYTTDENGDTVLAYEIDISGGFSSGTNGANLEGVPGRLEIDYDGTDLLRARDLATIESDFNLDVTFAPYNIGFLAQTLGDILFENTYTPRVLNSFLVSF